MNLQDVLNNCLYIILTMILPVIAAYIVNLIKSKIKESEFITETTKNEAASLLIKDALSDVMDAVLYVNQIYTDSLKASGKFDQKAQTEAFNRAYVEAVNMISEESKKVVETLYGSFDKWLQLKIEAAVNTAKSAKT